ncbi:MAG TPA: histidine phosphatase family protein [Marmoricola sp.]|nr:histidine phosphatase family protein [Marmoricola sp.]
MSAPIYLVRHGQSEWNVLRLTQGQTSHPALTDLGRSQAQAAADVIAADLGAAQRRPAQLVTSDLLRARQTADIIAASLGMTVIIDSRLREQHLGALEGKSYDETWAAADQHDWSDPGVPIAGGESPLAVRERMARALDDLAPDQVHIVVSHGDAIRAAIARFRGEAAQDASWLEVANGAVARVTERIEWLNLPVPAAHQALRK